jgi:ABC-2 type transport system ATP-binding protein
MSGTTVFLTTHYLEEAEQADRVCVIDGGRIVAAGTPAELKAQLTAEWLVVDAAAGNRAALADELAGLQLTPAAEPGGGFRLGVGGSRAHEILRTIQTPLTLVRTHAPSLEDAYLEIVGRRAETEDENRAAGEDRAAGQGSSDA